MATFFTTAAKDAMVNTLTITHVSLHSANPSNNGSQYELTSPMYARQPASLAATNNGVRLLNEDVIFSVTAGDQVSHIGYWNNTTFVSWVELPFVDTAAEDKDIVLKTSKNGLSVI